LKAPFPYFGGKSTVAQEVWQRFGNVKNYVEPFAGSAAVLLKRPLVHFIGDKRIETINDFDGMVSNFWRSIAFKPEETAMYADWPVNENDLHARHRWLIGKKESLKVKLENNPNFCDPKIAGWWVWGICLWIGGGFCKQTSTQVPVLSHCGDPTLRGVPRKLIVTSRNKGIHQGKKPYMGGGHGGDGRGIFRLTKTLFNEKPYLSNAGRGKKRIKPNLGFEKGINRARRMHLGRDYQIQSQSNEYNIYEDFLMLSDRLRHVRVICGSWDRVTSPTATYYHSGITGIFLDPPYPHKERDRELYAEDHDVFEEAWTYAMENGDNPKMRIAICGLDDGRSPEKGWTTFRWKANGGYSRLGDGKNKGNANRETIWFSPFCLQEGTRDLFEIK
jgi:site-specific DNA-adenine methylase